MALTTSRLLLLLTLLAAAAAASPAAAQTNAPAGPHPYPVPSTTVDTTSCVLYGVTPTTGNPAALKPFQTVFPIDSVDPSWPAAEAQSKFLPAYASLPLYTNGSAAAARVAGKIDTVLISWHGITAYANGHFCHVYGQYVAAENRQRNVLVVVPAFFPTQVTLDEWFLTKPSSSSASPVSAQDWTGDQVPDLVVYRPVSLFWSDKGGAAGVSATAVSADDGYADTPTWPSGGNANTRAADLTLTGYASSFDVADQVTQFFLTGPGAALFPNVKLITHVSKQSAGASFLQRWAWASTVGLASSRLPVRFAILDAYTYT